MELTQLFSSFQNSHFYPHPVQSEIKLIQTHCSAVFLTGDYAYKLKKPVDFGFLDYSTLEKRHYYLTQELELNRAIAPDISANSPLVTSANSPLSKAPSIAFSCLVNLMFLISCHPPTMLFSVFPAREQCL